MKFESIELKTCSNEHLGGALQIKYFFLIKPPIYLSRSASAYK